MIQLLLYILIAFLLFKSVQSTSWALIGILMILLMAPRLEDYISFYNGLLYLFAGIGVAKMFADTLNTKSGFRIRLDRIQLYLLIFILFILFSSPLTALGQGTRNWVSTYTQLLLFTILASNAVRDLESLIQLMKWFIVLNALNIWLIFFDPDVDLSNGKFDMDGANDFGRYYFTALVFLIGLLNFKQKKVFSSAFGLIVFCTLIFGILFSQSRSIMILLVPYLLWILYKYYKLSVSSVLFLGVGSIILIQIIPQELIINTWRAFTGEAYEGTHGTGELNKIQNNIRLYLWSIGFEMLADKSFLFGTGIGGYGQLFQQYNIYPTLVISNPHNTYLSILFETGIIGFSLFMGIIFTGIRNLVQKANKSPILKLFRETWLVALIIILLAGLTKHDHYSKLLFVLLGLTSCFKFWLNPRYRIDR